MSGKPAKNLNSKRTEWYTPKEVLEHFRIKDRKGPVFDYDPATTMEMAAYHGIPNFDTKYTDGLKSDWSKYSRIWINPPFDKKAEFLKKAVDNFVEHYTATCILLPIEFITTKTFHKIMSAVPYEMHIPNGRIKFLNGNGSVSPAFGSVVIELKAILVESGIKHWKL